MIFVFFLCNILNIYFHFYHFFDIFRINMINDKDIFIKAKKMFESLITHKLVKKDGTFVLEDTVFVSGLGPADNLRRDGSKKYYLSEPKMTDSPIGTASIITAYSQWLMINNT